jgi:hypothetical protein
MKDKLKKIVLGVAALAALALGGSAIAGATSGGDDSSDKALTGDILNKASKAALAETGGGTIGQTETDNEKGATYEVEVTKPDGTQVDVRLDDQFKVVAVDGDSEESGAEENAADEGPDRGPDADSSEPGHQDAGQDESDGAQQSPGA